MLAELALPCAGSALPVRCGPARADGLGYPPGPVRNCASRLSSSGTGEWGSRAARSRRDCSTGPGERPSGHRASAASAAWAYRPRMPGTWCPSRCSAGISGMPLERCLVAVPEAVGRQPVLDRQPARQRHVVGGRVTAARAVVGRGLVADDRPVEAQLYRVPAGWAAARVLRPDQARGALPDGGSNGSPGTTGGHDATGMPGHAVASTTTSLPGCPFAGGCRPSQAGRRRVARSCCAGGGPRQGRGIRSGRCRRAQWRRRIADVPASRPGRSAVRRGMRRATTWVLT